jgi:nucleoside-diphosphate-sugar epimerase
LRQEKACFTEYEQSKCLAEEKAAEFTAKGLFLATACPTRVYGPGKLTEANSVTKMIRMYLRNRIGLVLARGTEVGNYVLAEDVVEGLLKIMDKGRNGERYILGGENISLSGFYDLLKEVSGRRALRVPVPKKLAFAIAGLEESLAGRFGIYPFITRDWVETFLQNWAFSSRKAEQELGYRPKTLREGLAITCAWLGYPVQSRLQERGRP